MNDHSNEFTASGSSPGVRLSPEDVAEIRENYFRIERKLLPLDAAVVPSPEPDDWRTALAERKVIDINWSTPTAEKPASQREHSTYAHTPLTLIPRAEGSSERKFKSGRPVRRKKFIERTQRKVVLVRRARIDGAVTFEHVADVVWEPWQEPVAADFQINSGRDTVSKFLGDITQPSPAWGLEPTRDCPAFNVGDKPKYRFVVGGYNPSAFSGRVIGGRKKPDEQKEPDAAQQGAEVEPTMPEYAVDAFNPDDDLLWYRAEIDHFIKLRRERARLDVQVSAYENDSRTQAEREDILRQTKKSRKGEWSPPRVSVKNVEERKRIQWSVWDAPCGLERMPTGDLPMAERGDVREWNKSLTYVNADGEVRQILRELKGVQFILKKSQKLRLVEPGLKFNEHGERIEVGEAFQLWIENPPVVDWGKAIHVYRVYFHGAKREDVLLDKEAQNVFHIKTDPDALREYSQTEQRRLNRRYQAMKKLTEGKCPTGVCGDNNRCANLNLTYEFRVLTHAVNSVVDKPDMIGMLGRFYCVVEIGGQYRWKWLPKISKKFKGTDQERIDMALTKLASQEANAARRQAIKEGRDPEAAAKARSALFEGVHVYRLSAVRKAGELIEK